MGSPSPRAACTLQLPARDGEEMQAEAPTRPCRQERAVPGVQRGLQLAGCGVSGISGPPFALSAAGGPGQAVAATACVGMPSSVACQKGPSGSDTAHRLTASPEASWEAPQNSLGAGTPTPGGRSAPHDIRTPRLQTPQRRAMGTAQLTQGQPSSKRRPGSLGGPRGTQGLETQQPHRWHGVAPAAGGLAQEKDECPPQQRAACLQRQRGQAQGQGDPAVPWAGPQGEAPGVTAAGGQGWGGRPGACMVWRRGDRRCREQDGACRGGSALGGSGSGLGANLGQAPCGGMVLLPAWRRSTVGRGV